MTKSKPDPLNNIVWGVDEKGVWHTVWGNSPTISIANCLMWAGRVSITEPAGLPPKGSLLCTECMEFVTRLIVEEA